MKSPMKTELSKTFHIEAAHHLPHVPKGHKCGRIHGHSFKITLTLSGKVDEKMGWVVDYGDVKAAFKPLYEQLDHNYLNEVAGLENPTSENLAAWVANRFVLDVDGVTLSSVEVAETCNSACRVVL